MPDYPRIKGIELDGNAYADILMVLEFIHNFGDALGFGKITSVHALFKDFCEK